MAAVLAAVAVAAQLKAGSGQAVWLGASRPQTPAGYFGTEKIKGAAL